MKIEPPTKKRTPYLKYEDGSKVFNSVDPGMLRVFSEGIVADGILADGFLKSDPEILFESAIVLFDEDGIFLRKLSITPSVGTYTSDKFSYTGKKILISPYKALAYVDFSEPEKAIQISEDEKNLDAIFLREDEAIIYQTADFKIKRYDINTRQLEVLIEASKPILFGDVSYDNTKILCTDESRILILDLTEKKIKTIKEYHPSLFTFRRNTPGSPKYSRPIIVTGQFSWREDGKGFIFCRYGPWANFLWLGLDESYNEPDLYYFDLETGKETLLWGGTGKGGIALRKKLRQDEVPKLFPIIGPADL